MQRRAFIQTSSGLAWFLFLPFELMSKSIFAMPLTRIIKPRKLNQGDTVGIIAPGFAISEERLTKCIANIEALGFKPYYTKRILKNHGYLSNTDEERLNDFHHHITNPRVKAIFCARGGYGCTRLLKDIDFKLVKRNPKILMGFSDVTSLLNIIYQQTGLITFHGPVAATLNNGFCRKSVNGVLVNPEDPFEIDPADVKKQQLSDSYLSPAYTITPGSAEGVLAGGNLSLVASMVGTPYQIDFDNKIVFLEDVGEKPYRIDRMLTQLTQAGVFKKAKAILFGVFEDCEAPDTSQSFTLKQVLEDRIAPLNIPSAYGFPFGHISYNSVLPIGGKVQVNTQNIILKFREIVVEN